jgi:hypothetical protein
MTCTHVVGSGTSGEGEQYNNTQESRRHQFKRRRSLSNHRLARRGKLSSFNAEGCNCHHDRLTEAKVKDQRKGYRAGLEPGRGIRYAQSREGQQRARSR